MAQTSTTGASQGLRRELKVTDAAAFSIGLIGPVGAMALLGVGAAGLLGAGATLAFLFAIVGVGLVAYGFVKLSRHVAHSGSVYALVGTTLGPRAGFVAGWALFGAYTAIGTGSTIEIALFSDKVLQGLGLGSPTEWIWTALIALALVVALSFTEIRIITRVLLVSELLGAGLVALLSLWILVRVGTGHAPAGQTLSWHFLSLPPGSGMGTVAAAAVFGFLAFAGFEGAAALGEETLNPRREIPRAITIAVFVVGAFFLLTIIAQSIGYGTDAKGVKAFAGAASPYGDLATAYVGKALAVLLNFVASLSLFAITLGTLNGAARISYALARDAGGPPRLTRLSRVGAPETTLLIVCSMVLVFMLAQRLAGTGVEDATFYWLTIGTLSLLVAYGLATVGAFRFLFLQGPRKAPAWQAVIPVLALCFVLYTIGRNVIGVTGPYRFFPLWVLLWLLVALALVLLVRGLSERVRRGLADSASEPTQELDAA